MKILIIEDEIELLETMKNYLESAGFLCETASSYFMAEDSLSVFNYDIIVLDLTLPGAMDLTLSNLLRRRTEMPVF